MKREKKKNNLAWENGVSPVQLQCDLGWLFSWEEEKGGNMSSWKEGVRSCVSVCVKIVNNNSGMMATPWAGKAVVELKLRFISFLFLL